MSTEDKRIEDNILSEELENVTGGIGYYKAYTCVNENCSQYLIYLQFQPEGNACPVCGQQMGGIM